MLLKINSNFNFPQPPLINKVIATIETIGEKKEKEVLSVWNSEAEKGLTFIFLKFHSGRFHRGKDIPTHGTTDQKKLKSILIFLLHYKFHSNSRKMIIKTDYISLSINKVGCRYRQTRQNRVTSLCSFNKAVSPPPPRL